MRIGPALAAGITVAAAFWWFQFRPVSNRLAEATSQFDTDTNSLASLRQAATRYPSDRLRLKHLEGTIKVAPALSRSQPVETSADALPPQFGADLEELVRIHPNVEIARITHTAMPDDPALPRVPHARFSVALTGREEPLRDVLSALDGRHFSRLVRLHGLTWSRAAGDELQATLDLEVYGRF